MSETVPAVLSAVVENLTAPKEVHENEYPGDDGLLYCSKCHTPVQCRVNIWGREKIVRCICQCQKEAMEVRRIEHELYE